MTNEILTLIDERHKLKNKKVDYKQDSYQARKQQKHGC